MSDAKYKVTISGPGMSFEREVEQAQADAVLRRLLGGAEAREDGGGSSAGSLEDLPPGDAPAEFLKAASATTGLKQIAALAAYHKKTGNKDFDADQLEALFSQAGEQAPAKMLRDIKLTVAKGWIAELPKQKGHFYITNTGLAAVKNGFKDEGATRRKRRRGAASKAK